MLQNLSLYGKHEKLKTLLNQRSFSLTSLQLATPGAIKRFPVASLSRFILPTVNPKQVASYAGSFLSASTAIGGNKLSLDYLPDLGDNLNLNIQGQIISTKSVQSTTATLRQTCIKDLAKGDQALIDSYWISVQGTYPEGTQQLVILSPQPIFCGDQLVFYSGSTSFPVTVFKATKTQTVDQWDVELEAAIPFDLNNEDKILIQASSCCYWKDIPLSVGPCRLTLPAITHLENSQAIVVSYVKLKSGSNVIKSFYTADDTIQIVQCGIPAHSWNSAIVYEGAVDYCNGIAHLIPKLGGRCFARIKFMDTLVTEEQDTWSININCFQDGRLTLLVDDRAIKTFDLKRGIQSLYFQLEPQSFSSLAINTTASLTLGQIGSNQISSVDVAIHVFNQEYLGSHIIAAPAIVGLLRDASLTWAKVGTARTNAGFTVSPFGSSYVTPIKEPESIKWSAPLDTIIPTEEPEPEPRD
jgi:hypothetical protein